MTCHHCSANVSVFRLACPGCGKPLRPGLLYVISLAGILWLGHQAFAMVPLAWQNPRYLVPFIFQCLFVIPFVIILTGQRWTWGLVLILVTLNTLEAVRTFIKTTSTSLTLNQMIQTDRAVRENLANGLFFLVVLFLLNHPSIRAFFSGAVDDSIRKGR